MFKIKELLCDIVANTYGKECNPAYLRFYVEISEKNSKSYHGLYNERSHKINIYNTYRDDESILCTTVHELAHHIDCCNRGRSDHQKEFYAEYEKLLFTAMDMGIIHKEKFLETTRDASDSNKIRKMMERYEPNPIEYKQGKYVVSVYNCYAYKDFLKNRGYHFNGNTKAWEKEVANADEECKKLEALAGARVEISKATDLHFAGAVKLVATGNTYPIKDELNAAGFRFEKKSWVYYAASEADAAAMERRFKNIKFCKK